MSNLISMKVEKYDKKEGTKTGFILTNQETKKIDQKTYRNQTSKKFYDFFKDLGGYVLVKDYFKCGIFNAQKVTFISPDKDLKTVYKYYFYIYN